MSSIHRKTLATALLLGIGAAGACGEPRCPSGYTKKGDTCYRNKDGGSQTTEEVEGGDAATLEAGAEDDPNEDTEARDLDAGTPAADGAIDAAQADDVMTAAVDGAAPPDGAQPLDASSQSDSAQIDAGAITCASEPCLNGGTCTNRPTGFQCSCPEPFMGERCESKICPTLFLRNDEDLEKAQSCAEIRGNLTVTSAGIASITESDLPYLTKITGHFSMSGQANNGVETPRLRALRVPKLREIGGALTMSQTGPDSLREIHFPLLARVAGGIVVMGTETRRLELPALRTVDTGLWLTALRRLCTLEIDAIERISGDLMIVDIPNLPASTLEPVRRAYSGTPTADDGIGCCLPVDSKCSGGFTQPDREAFCGCSAL